MRMVSGWQEAYKELTDFIAEHSEVKIEESLVRIPKNIRPEFYQLFDTVGTALIKEKFPDLLSEARILSEIYKKVEQEVTELLKLDDISMVANLGRFLHDPVDELGRGVIDPLFDLLKLKVGIEVFEERTSQNIEASFRVLYRRGYEKWVALSLLKLLEVNKSFDVILREVFIVDTHKAGGLLEEDVPPPQESKGLSFKHDLEVAFIVPDSIVHSAKVNRYIALRSEIGRALCKVTNAIEKREWYPLDSVVVPESGLTLVYVGDDPEEVSLIADADKICRPDLIIECRGQKDWYGKEGLEKIKLHHDSLKPRLGTFIVSRSVPELKPKEQEEGIHILSVGFDQSKLESIINILMNTEAKDE